MHTESPSNEAPPEADPVIGTTIDGRYQVHSLLARGGMGKVYLAEQLNLGRVVALKLLGAAAVHEEASAAVRRFLAEASTLAKLTHPNTVRIFDYGVHKGCPWLVMEYVEGHSLKAALREGPMAPKQVVQIGIQIAQALQEAHRHDVIHRDLKPSNILLTTHGSNTNYVKVVDFGLVKQIGADTEDITIEGIIIGTPSYMAPEQILRRPNDARTDVFGLGVLMYRALTGTTPWPRGPAAEMLSQRLRDPPASLASTAPTLSIPPSLEWVLMRCMRTEPEDRFADAGEVVTALEAAGAALDDPTLWNMELKIDDGRVIVPQRVASRKWWTRESLQSVALFLLGLTMLAAAIVVLAVTLTSTR